MKTHLWSWLVVGVSLCTASAAVVQTPVGALAIDARQAALRECRSRGGGSGCVVRVWGCNGPVVEEELGLDRAARRRIQQGLPSAGFNPGGADGLFGPRTRVAIRGWQSSRGARPTGYLDGAAVKALRSAGAFRPRGSGGGTGCAPCDADGCSARGDRDACR